MSKTEYKLIPMSEITDEAREIAVAWIDNYVPNGSIMPEIAQKQKLASDIMNYADQRVSEALNEYKEKLIKEIRKVRAKSQKQIDRNDWENLEMTPATYEGHVMTCDEIIGLLSTT